MKYKPDDRDQQAPDPAFDPERDVAGVGPGDHGLMGAHDIQRYLRSRVPGSNYQDRPVLQLGGVPVVGRMQLFDLGSEIRGEVREAGDLPAGHGHDHGVGLEPGVVRFHDEGGVPLREARHSLAASHREGELGRVRLQIVGHLVLGWKRMAGSGEGLAVEPVIPGRGEQAERVPPAPPGPTDRLRARRG